LGGRPILTPDDRYRCCLVPSDRRVAEGLTAPRVARALSPRGRASSRTARSRPCSAGSASEARGLATCSPSSRSDGAVRRAPTRLPDASRRMISTSRSDGPLCGSCYWPLR